MTHSAITKTRGVTLVELLVAIAVLAILTTIAAPSLTQVIHNNRVASQNNELVALINLAKSQAIRRNSDHVIEFIIAPDGWNAYLNRDLTEDEGSDPTCEVTAIRCAEHQGVALSTIDSSEQPLIFDGQPLIFDQRGYLAGLQPRALVLQNIPCRGERQRRVIRITATGQISSESALCE